MRTQRRVATYARRAAAVGCSFATVLGMSIALPAVASAKLPPVTASTAGLVYDNIPTPTPGNVSSEAFEAQSASEFGGAVTLTSGVSDPTVRVLMSSWGCQSGSWFNADCASTPGATFTEPITLNVYAPGSGANGSAPGGLLTTTTQTFAIPFRPSADPTHCTGTNLGKWYDAASATCFNGFATPVAFHLTASLPANVVISVAYNTTHSGYAPYGESTACYGTSGGCGYDSLNVGLNGSPSVGSDPLPDVWYLNSSWPGAYCTANPGVGSFVASTGCGAFGQPAIEVQAGSVATSLHANPSIAQILPGLKIYLKLSARLTTTAGNPVQGEPVAFTAGGHAVCTAVTDANGDAACGGLLTGVLRSVLSLGYTATFAGDAPLLPSSGHGSLVVIG
jgi:hypothetical protein